MSLPFTHIKPRSRDLERRFGLWSPDYISFHPIYSVEDLAQACHCPRKALFLMRRGNYVTWTPPQNYYRRIGAQDQTIPWQDNSFFKHSTIFIETIISVLSRLSTRYNLLRNRDPRTNQDWDQVLNNEISERSSMNHPFRSLKSDLIDFFSLWYTQGRLSDFFSHPTNFLFSISLFNPEMTIDTPYPVDRNRGRAEGTFPIRCVIHLLDFQNNRIIEFVCHRNDWFLEKEDSQRGTVSEDSDRRRCEIFWRPYEYKTWIIRRAIATLPEKYRIGAEFAANQQYGVLPSSLFPNNDHWEEFFSDFEVEIATPDEFRIVDSDLSSHIVDGLISMRLSVVGNSYRLLRNDPNPCNDPNIAIVKDNYCSMLFECYRKSIGFMFPDMRAEIKRVERQVFHNRILNRDWRDYQLAHFLPHNPGVLNAIHSNLWLGDVIDTTPLKIQLDNACFPEGLGIGSNYTIPHFTPFFSPQDDYLLTSRSEDDPIVLTFDQGSSLQNNSRVVILKTKNYRELEKTEQNSLYHHLLASGRVSLSSTEDVAAHYQRILRRGGSRTGQATFGGWARFQ